MARKEWFAAAFNDEEPVTLQSHIGRGRTGLNRALRKDRHDLCDLGAETGLARVGATGGGGRLRSQAEILKKLSRERNTRLFEADRLRVGEVIADHVDLRFRSGEAC